jgi:hypothetical protein
MGLVHNVNPTMVAQRLQHVSPRSNRAPKPGAGMNGTCGR